MKTGSIKQMSLALVLLIGSALFLMVGRIPPQQALAQTREVAPSPQKMVARIWHGRVRTERADEYSAYLQKEGIEKIEAIHGNLGAQMLRHTEGKVTEFMVISYWPSRDAIHAFAGADIEKTHNLPRDKEFLLEMEPKVKHFDVLHDSRKTVEEKP
jgi:heme-degrading monooxygenase HmoA